MIGGHESFQGLARLLNGTNDADFRKKIIEAMGFVKESSARDFLLQELAMICMDDPEAVDILEALEEKPIPGNAVLIADFLIKGKDDQARTAAARALSDATESFVPRILSEACQNEKSDDVRIAVLEALKKRARPEFFPWLRRTVMNEKLDVDERSAALEAVLRCSSRYAGLSAGPTLKRLAGFGDDVSRTARKLTMEMLDPSADPEIAAVAASYSYLLGEEFGPVLTEICRDENRPFRVRTDACSSLGKLRYLPSAEALLSIVRKYPDVPDDEQAPLLSSEDHLARAAAEALSKIDPTVLCGLDGKTVQTALIRHSLRTGCLVFSDHVLDQAGRRIACGRNRGSSR